MPLHRVALLHDVIVPDKNVVKYPAVEVNKAPAPKPKARSVSTSVASTSSALGHACRTLANGSSSSSVVPSLSPLMLGSARRTRHEGPRGSPTKKNRVAVGHARAYIQLKRQMQQAVHPPASSSRTRKALQNRWNAVVNKIQPVSNPASPPREAHLPQRAPIKLAPVLAGRNLPRPHKAANLLTAFSGLAAAS